MWSARLPVVTHEQLKGMVHREEFRSQADAIEGSVGEAARKGEERVLVFCARQYASFHEQLWLHEDDRDIHKPKQFLPLEYRAVLAHALSRLGWFGHETELAAVADKLKFGKLLGRELELLQAKEVREAKRAGRKARVLPSIEAELSLRDKYGLGDYFAQLLKGHLASKG